MIERSWMRFPDSLCDNRKSKTCTELRRSIQNRKWVGIVAVVVIFAMCGEVASAQQPTKISRIGYLTTPALFAEAARMEAFRQGLRELGYAEGKNIVIEWRSAEGKLDGLPALAAELVRLRVNVIVTAGGISTRAVKEATATIPIVMTNDPDPVADGFVASLARPGGNITGLSALAPELSGKRLEILTEVVPKLSRVAVLGASTGPGSGQQLRDVEPAAKAFKVQLQFLEVGDPKDIEPAFRAASQGRAQAVLTLAGPILSFQRTQIVELTAKNRPSDIPPGAVCRNRGTYVLRREPSRLGPARCHVCGQDPERRQTRRSFGRATEEVRTDDQSQNGQADRVNDSSQRASESG